jgi:hypothetical protein
MRIVRITLQELDLLEHLEHSTSGFCLCCKQASEDVLRSQIKGNNNIHSDVLALDFLMKPCSVNPPQGAIIHLLMSPDDNQ